MDRYEETRDGLDVGLRRGSFTSKDVREALILVKRALGALSGLQSYLRSPRARENARRARERHIQRAKAAEGPVPNQRTYEPTQASE